MRIIKAIHIKFWATDPVSGAQTTLYCALQENIELLSGRYFSDSQLVQVKPEARDDVIAKKLWDISEKLCGMAWIHRHTHCCEIIIGIFLFWYINVSFRQSSEHTESYLQVGNLKF